jgi:serine protease Do
MNEKIFIKEKKEVPKLLLIAIVAIVASLIGSAFTYVLLDKKISSITTNTASSSSTGNVKYQISTTDSPVVAIAKKAGPSIVGVKITYVSQNNFGGLQEADEEGSGIIYSEDGYIITNYHVIESAITNSNAKVTVTLANSEESLDAKIIGSDEVSDLAVIKIDKTGLTAAEIGKSQDLQVGDLAVAIGNPLGQELAGSVTVGYISALNREITTDGKTLKLLQTDAAINPGNSGGALVNSQGQIIGINTAKIGSDDVEGLGFAIPTDDAMVIIKELITSGKIVRPYIGISGIDLDKNTATRYNLVEGIYIVSVTANSPATKAGLQKGDVIISVDGKTVTQMKELNEMKNAKKVGDTMTLKINRNSKEIEVKITLEESVSTNQ